MNVITTVIQTFITTVIQTVITTVITGRLLEQAVYKTGSYTTDRGSQIEDERRRRLLRRLIYSGLSPGPLACYDDSL